MRPIIEFCVSNMSRGTEKVFKLLEANPDYDVIEYGCLGNCGECAMFPYALVNGRMVMADTADELYEKILAAIESEEDEWAHFDLD